MSMSPYGSVTTVATGDTVNLPTTNEIPVNMHSRLWESYPQVTPLTAILSKLSSVGATNFRIDWQETHRVPHQMVVAAALTDSGTALTVLGNAQSLVKDTHLVNLRTFEQIKVSAQPTTATAVTLTSGRAAGGTTAAAMVAGDVLYVLPTSVPEDETDSTSGFYRTASVADSNVYNLMQILRFGLETTRVMDGTATHFGGQGSKRTQLQRQKYMEARTKYELLCILGGRSSGGTAPATLRTAGGLIHYLRNGTLYKDFNGIFTESGFRRMLGDYKDENPDSMNLMLFLAGNVMDLIDMWGLPNIRLSPRSKELGLAITRYRFRGLDVDLVPMPLFTDAEGKGWGFGLDLDRIMLKVMNGGEFTLHPDVKGIGQSEKIIDVYRIVTSLMLANENRHFMFVGAKN